MASPLPAEANTAGSLCTRVSDLEQDEHFNPIPGLHGVAALSLAEALQAAAAGDGNLVQHMHEIQARLDTLCLSLSLSCLPL